MQIAQAIGIFLIFAICVVLMMTRKLPTILALPIMAIGISLVEEMNGMPSFLATALPQTAIESATIQSGA